VKNKIVEMSKNAKKILIKVTHEIYEGIKGEIF
jgi:hypothetical protein